MISNHKCVPYDLMFAIVANFYNKGPIEPQDMNHIFWFFKNIYFEKLLQILQNYYKNS